MAVQNVHWFDEFIQHTYARTHVRTHARTHTHTPTHTHTHTHTHRTLDCKKGTAARSHHIIYRAVKSHFIRHISQTASKFLLLLFQLYPRSFWHTFNPHSWQNIFFKHLLFSAQPSHPLQTHLWALCHIASPSPLLRTSHSVRYLTVDYLGPHLWHHPTTAVRLAWTAITSLEIRATYTA